MPVKQQQAAPLPFAKDFARACGAGGVHRQTSTGLTFSRHWLKHLANETMDIAKQGYYVNGQGERVEVREDLERAIQGSEHYHSSYVFSAPKVSGPFANRQQTTIFIICYASSLQVAAELVNHHEKEGSTAHVGVLSSASAKNPSKFMRGTVSQEEVICRSSLLYPCLSQYEFLPHHFYVVNNKPKYKDTSSACAIFSPHVPVIRTDGDVRGTLLDDYYTCSFVSIPAPNAFVLGGHGSTGEEQLPTVPKAEEPGKSSGDEPVERITLQQAMEDRVFRALCMFANAGCTDLVLGAFGCGVHGNHPESVAKIFKECLKQFPGYFRTVVFAIQPSRTGNYAAFKAVFPEATAL